MNWWPATATTPEKQEVEEALTLFGDFMPGLYDPPVD